MKKEWIMREGRGSRKHRLASIPQEDEEIKKMFDQLAEGDVTVPKQVLVELVKKSKLGLDYSFQKDFKFRKNVGI